MLPGCAYPQIRYGGPGRLNLSRACKVARHAGFPLEVVTMPGNVPFNPRALNSGLKHCGKMLFREVRAPSSQIQPAPKQVDLMSVVVPRGKTMSGLFGPAQNLFLLDLRNGFSRVKTFWASLYAIHNRPTGVKLHWIVEIFQPLHLMRVT